jgi:AcrR family transcriptional regulator
VPPKTPSKTPRLMERKRGMAREVMLDAAERLLNINTPPDFSMRALCDEAGVSFTTPFNYFGNKSGIITALANRLIEEIHNRYNRRPISGDVIDRLFNMARIGAEVFLERPSVNRYIAGTSFTSEGERGATDMFGPAAGLWVEALGSLEGLEDAQPGLAERTLPIGCAIAFRGVMALWISQEIQDQEFTPMLEAQVAALLLGFAPAARRPHLTTIIESAHRAVDRHRG